MDIVWQRYTYEYTKSTRSIVVSTSAVTRVLYVSASTNLGMEELRRVCE